MGYNFHHDVVCLIISQGKRAVHNSEGYRVVEGGSSLYGDFRAGDETHLSDSPPQFSPNLDGFDNARLVFGHPSHIDYCHCRLPACLPGVFEGYRSIKYRSTNL